MNALCSKNELLGHAISCDRTDPMRQMTTDPNLHMPGVFTTRFGRPLVGWVNENCKLIFEKEHPDEAFYPSSGIHRTRVKILGLDRSFGVPLYLHYYLKGYALCRRPLLAPWGCHLGIRYLYFSAPGNHFHTSGAPRRTILAPRDHPGIPSSRMDSIEVVVYRFYLILE